MKSMRSATVRSLCSRRGDEAEHGSKRQRGIRLLASAAATSLLLLTTLSAHADRFGDISVSPQVTTAGETYHGYREFRIRVENHSVRRTHRVTLIIPDRPYSWGNSISRIERTVSLGPETSAVVPLWQPPLPQNGNGLIRIQIAGEQPETLHLPAFSHADRRSHYGGAPMPATVLVSRNLNYDDLGRVLKSDRSAMAASTAVGMPDARGLRGLVPQVWSPDRTASGPHWLELDYDPPMQADGLKIHETMGLPPVGEIVLIGVSGSNVATVPISSAIRSSTGPRPVPREYSFPRVAEPVKTVRLDFQNTYPGSIAIDAVELTDSTAGPGSSWATTARASSESASPSHSGMPTPDARQLLRSEVPVPEWSEHWLSYTPFDAVALHSSDLKAIPPAVLTALHHYAEAGGNLVVFGAAEIPEAWRRSARSELRGGRLFDAGLGRCFAFASESAGNVDPADAKHLTDALTESVQKWQAMPDESTANVMFPVVENARIPVRGIVFIMLGFVLVIGPVNLIVLSRMQRRTWLLWTIPAISVFTSLVVFVYSLVREGFTPDTRTQTLTFLDQNTRRAATVGTTAIYSPLTPGAGLFFSLETEATPMIQSWDFNQGTSREVNWTRGQNLGRGWVSARVPTHFSVRKAESRRERLQLERSGDTLAVVNGLGAAITSLWLADETGTLYHASSIPAGLKGALNTASDSEGVIGSLGPAKLRAELAMTAFEKLSVKAPAYLAPGTYVAELDANPFLENPLGPKAASARTRSGAIVYGVLEVQP